MSIVNDIVAFRMSVNSCNQSEFWVKGRLLDLPAGTDDTTMRVTTIDMNFAS